MSKDGKGILVGVHFSKFFGRPGRVKFFPGELRVTPRGQATRVYSGTMTVKRKLTEPFFANHWLELHALDGNTVWLTCSKKRALMLSKMAEDHGIEVEWV